MTDNEIIKALELVADDYTDDCYECNLKRVCRDKVCPIHANLYALSLIHRQKAEIERLQKHIQEGIDLAKQIPEMVALAQAEAIKEFAERLKEYVGDDLYFEIETNAFLTFIDKIIYEMTGYADKPKITCLRCKHLMFSDMYGECKIQLRIVNPSDTCEYAELSDEQAGDHQ